MNSLVIPYRQKHSGNANYWQTNAAPTGAMSNAKSCHMVLFLFWYLFWFFSFIYFSQLPFKSSYGVGFNREVDDSAFGFGHHVDTVGDALRPNTTILQPLKGEVVRAPARGSIDLDSSSLHGIAHQDGLVNIPCEHTPLEGKGVSIAVVDALFRRLDAENRDHRSKWLLPGYPHVRLHIVYQHWPYQVPLTPPFLMEFGSLLPGIIHKALNEVSRRLTDNRGDVTVFVRRTHCELLHLFHHPLHQIICHRLHHTNDLHCCAPLATVGVATFDDVVGSQLQVSIL